MKVDEIRKALDAYKPQRGIWNEGVKDYAFDLLEILNYEYTEKDFNSENIKELKNILLNGASDWLQYSEGGCSLIYDYEIKERLVCPSQRNRHFDCIYMQARALNHAWNLIRNIINNRL